MNHNLRVDESLVKELQKEFQQVTSKYVYVQNQAITDIYGRN